MALLPLRVSYYYLLKLFIISQLPQQMWDIERLICQRNRSRWFGSSQQTFTTSRRSGKMDTPSWPPWPPR